MLVTPLPPIENCRVRGVATKRYDLNHKCAHPECNEDADDPHHIFPRSLITGDSWWVRIGTDEEEPPYTDEEWAIAHVTGLCRAHHDDVEEHRAWIKMEELPKAPHHVFVWYDRGPDAIDNPIMQEEADPWIELGPLNPQPGSRDGKPKRSRKRHQGEARRKRATVSLRVPDDAQEDGAGLLDEAIERVEDLLYPDRPEGEKRRPAYFTLMDALEIAAIELQNPGRDE